MSDEADEALRAAVRERFSGNRLRDLAPWLDDPEALIVADDAWHREASRRYVGRELALRVALAGR